MTKLYFTLCICLAITTAALAANKICSEEMVVRYGCDYRGNDIGSPRDLSQAECGYACLRDKKCTHFSFTQDPRKCYLKQASTLQEALSDERCFNKSHVCAYNPSRLSTEKSGGDCSDSLHTEYGVDCHGLDLPNQPTKGLSEDDCARACLQNSRCTHYSWHVNRDCYLKRANSRKEAMATRHCSPISVCGVDKSRFKTPYKCDVPLFDTQYERCIFNAPSIAEFPAHSNQGCAYKCINDTRCTHYSLPTDPLVCKLHRADSEQQAQSTRQCTTKEADCGIMKDRFPKGTGGGSGGTGGGTSDDCDMPDTELSKNCDFIGLHMPDGEVTGLSLEECINRCFNNPQCTHYTYYGPEKKCWSQKANSEEHALSTRVCRQNSYCGLIRENFPSPPLNCSGGFSALMSYDCNYPGLDLPNNPIYAWSIGECSRACVRDPRCTHISWLSGSQCYLKKADSQKQAVDTLNCVPGAVCSLIDRRLK